MAGISEMEAQWFAEGANRLKGNLSLAISGKPEKIELVVAAFLSEGHILLEDVPGTGKTTLARGLAQSISGDWKRIQFTPDLLPSDVTGAQVFDQSSGSFEFHKGAVFTNVLLADEINRASPKTQSALLEAMEERQHTVDGETYALPTPFVVVATQNPIEQDGTYRLPEAQLDRFLLKTEIGYLGLQDEIEVLSGSYVKKIKLESVLRVNDVRDLIDMSERVHVARSVRRYVAELLRASRDNDLLRLGVSTRGGLALLRVAQTYAAMSGVPHVTPDHIKHLVGPVFRHRLLLSHDAEFSDVTVGKVLDEIVGSVEPPSKSGD